MTSWLVNWLLQCRSSRFHWPLWLSSCSHSGTSSLLLCIRFQDWSLDLRKEWSRTWTVSISSLRSDSLRWHTSTSGVVCTSWTSSAYSRFASPLSSIHRAETSCFYCKVGQNLRDAFWYKKLRYLQWTHIWWISDSNWRFVSRIARQFKSASDSLVDLCSWMRWCKDIDSAIRWYSLSRMPSGTVPSWLTPSSIFARCLLFSRSTCFHRCEEYVQRMLNFNDMSSVGCCRMDQLCRCACSVMSPLACFEAYSE